MNASSVILIAFFTALVTAVGTVLIMKQGGMLTPAPVATASEGQVVPDLVGLGETEARANATNAHLSLLVLGREAMAGKKAGAVLRQSIPAGQRVPPNQPLGVVLADDLPKVPKIVGLSLAEASASVEKSGHKLTTSATVSDPTVPEGKVMEQD